MTVTVLRLYCSCSRFYGPKANDGSKGREAIDAKTWATWGVVRTISVLCDCAVTVL